MEILSKQDILDAYKSRILPNYITPLLLTNCYTHFSKKEIKPEFTKKDLDEIFKSIKTNNKQVNVPVFKKEKIKEKKNENELVWMIFGGNLNKGPYSLEDILKIINEKPDLNFLIKNTKKKNQILTSGYFLENYQNLLNTTPNQNFQGNLDSEKNSASEEDSFNDFKNEPIHNFSLNKSKSNISGSEIFHKNQIHFEKHSNFNYQNPNLNKTPGYFNYMHLNNINTQNNFGNKTSFDNIDNENFEKSNEDDQELFELINKKLSKFDDSIDRNINYKGPLNILKDFSEEEKSVKKKKIIDKNFYLKNFLAEQNNNMSNKNLHYSNYKQISKNTNSNKNSKIMETMNNKNFIEYSITSEQIEKEKKNKKIKNFDVDVFNSNEIVIPDSYFNKLHDKTNICKCDFPFCKKKEISITNNFEGIQNPNHVAGNGNVYSYNNYNNLNPKKKNKKKKKKLKKTSSNFVYKNNFGEKNQNNFENDFHNLNLKSGNDNYNNYSKFSNSSNKLRENLGFNNFNNDYDNDFSRDFKNNNFIQNNNRNYKESYDSDFGNFNQNLQNNYDQNYRNFENGNYNQKVKNSYNQNYNNNINNEGNSYQQNFGNYQQQNYKEKNFNQNYKNFNLNSKNQNYNANSKNPNYKGNYKNKNYQKQKKSFEKNFQTQKQKNPQRNTNFEIGQNYNKNDNYNPYTNNLQKNNTGNYNSPYFSNNNYKNMDNDNNMNFDFKRGLTNNFENKNRYNQYHKNSEEDLGNIPKKKKYNKKKKFNPKKKVYVKRLNKDNE